MMSIWEQYKQEIYEKQIDINSYVDSITFYVLISQTKHIQNKNELLEYLYELETKKMNELIAHNRNFNLRKPYSLEKEITTIKFLIASVEM